MFMRTMEHYLKKEDTVKSQDVFINFSKKKKKKQGGGEGRILEKLRMNCLIFTPSITLQDRELTVAQIMNSLLPNSDLN